MPISGYIKKQPDVGWWMDQIQAGEQFRKKVAYEQKWKTWREYYRGEWSRDVLPVNLFFTMARTIVPRIYFRDPSISVTPGKPGLLNLTFARMLERADNKIIRRMKLKKQMKKIVQNAFFFGTGVGKVGFGGFFTPAPMADEDTPTGKMGELVEYAQFTEPNMPWFASVRPINFVLPSGLTDFEYSRWVAEKVIRPMDDVRSDPRLENTKHLRASRNIQTPFGSVIYDEPMFEGYEVHDRKTMAVMVLTAHTSSKDHKGVLYFGPDTSQLYGGFNYFPVVFNEDDEHVWGIPDSKILEPYQLEINEIKTQIMKHRRLTLIKILASEKSISEEEAQRMVSEDVAAVVWVQGGNLDQAAKWVQSSTIPIELFKAAEETINDVRETVGFSRNQFGEFNSRSGDTTATEANIVRMASEIRVDERRDELADTLVDVVKHIHGVIFDHWTTDQIVDVVGPAGATVWIQFRGELLKTGRYNVKVDPDSSVPETRLLREQRAVQLYQLLKTNPLIDPVKLTQYLLHELKGVQFDDMMQMLPMPDGGTPNGPVPPEQFAQLVGNSINKIGRPGGKQPRVSPPEIARRESLDTTE